MIVFNFGKISRNFCSKSQWTQHLASPKSYSSKAVVPGKKTQTQPQKEDGTEPEVPRNLLEGVFSAQNQQSTGKIYDKKPFKMFLEAGKIYAWCLCGQSKGQPLCDKTHQNIYLKISHRPIFFKVKESKKYWLCNCKRTSNRPFCDGTHLSPEIQVLKR